MKGVQTQFKPPAGVAVLLFLSAALADTPVFHTSGSPAAVFHKERAATKASASSRDSGMAGGIRLAQESNAFLGTWAHDGGGHGDAVTERTDNPGVLDARRGNALGMIETGNRDGKIGGRGEVSRYQIMPSVWRQYSDSESYRDPRISLAVAQQHWTALYRAFKQQARREPTDFDMYVLWNTTYGYYASHGFDPARLGPVVRGRAQRYVNLVDDKNNGA